MLANALKNIPTSNDKNLIVGFDTSDDGAVYRLSDDLAIIQTLDFFPPMVDEPYIFGQIAAANALSDITAMGGTPKIALNILAFSEDESPSVLAAILAGGADKVAEAGAVLCGGHSITDISVKYGLSVTGTVHPKRIKLNNTCKVGDLIILTKPLGCGIITAAYIGGEVSEAAYKQAISIMTSLNSHVYSIAEKYPISGLTDVTGFGLIGHLGEMVNETTSIVLESGKILYINEAYTLAHQFMTTAGGAKNREFMEDKVIFKNVPRAKQEIMFDPQTSGGLLIGLKPNDAKQLVRELTARGHDCRIVAEVVSKRDRDILVF